MRTIKKAKHGRTDVVELWCWRRLLRVPCPARRLSQLILKEINPGIFIGKMDAEVEAPIFGHLMQKSDSLEKNLMLGKIEGRRRRG